MAVRSRGRRRGSRARADAAAPHRGRATVMRWNTFTRSTLFAAVAAAGWLPWVLVAAPILGVSNARAFYLVGTTALYIAGLSPRATRQITAGALAGLVAGGLGLAA